MYINYTPLLATLLPLLYPLHIEMALYIPPLYIEVVMFNLHYIFSVFIISVNTISVNWNGK